MESIRKALPIVGLIVIAVGLAVFGIFYSIGMKFAENIQETRIWVSLAVVAIGVLLTLLGVATKGAGPNLNNYLSYAVTSVFVLGSLVVIYLIVSNHSKEFDVTERKMYSLHPRTVEYLQNLEKDVRIIAFPSPAEKQRIEEFVKRYSRTSPRVNFEVRNLYKDVNVARQFGENIAMGDIFVEIGTRAGDSATTSPDFRQKKIDAYSARDLTESILTNAIVEIMRSERITVYFLKGHAEIGTDPSGGMFGSPGQDRPSYSIAESVLRNEMSFQVKTLELRRSGWVPEDCSLLICSGPQVDILPLEARAIADYLNKGGRALMLLDPNERLRVRFNQWEQLMARFGVEIKHDMVLERNPLTQLTGDPTILLVGRFGSHATVENQGEMIQMARVRTVAAHDDRPGTVTVSELMYSSDLSWAADIEQLRARELEMPDPDAMKALPLAVAVSMAAGLGDTDQTMRMIVVGDADIFEDRFLPNTARLFINFVNWLVAREDLIDIPTKELADTSIFPSQAKLRTVFTLLIMAFPGLILFGGLGYVFVRRRMR